MVCAQVRRGAHWQHCTLHDLLPAPLLVQRNRRNDWCAVCRSSSWSTITSSVDHKHTVWPGDWQRQLCLPSRCLRCPTRRKRRRCASAQCLEKKEEARLCQILTSLRSCCRPEGTQQVEQIQKEELFFSYGLEVYGTAIEEAGVLRFWYVALGAGTLVRTCVQHAQLDTLKAHGYKVWRMLSRVTAARLFTSQRFSVMGQTTSDW